MNNQDLFTDLIECASASWAFSDCKIRNLRWFVRLALFASPFKHMPNTYWVPCLAKTLSSLRDTKGREVTDTTGTGLTATQILVHFLQTQGPVLTKCLTSFLRCEGREAGGQQASSR